ncbi:hypothetical protein [Terrarubrum flagellatum]|uniref:hypothetical protein n=1 Tax=Terrirubrum flagellatum TaxID=2895980 RepID=UPI0031450743
MKYAFVLAAVAAIASSPAFAGGRGGLVSGVVIPVTTAISNVKVAPTTNVAVLSGNSIASGNKVNAPISIVGNKTGVLNGLIGGLGHGCGCN